MLLSILKCFLRWIDHCFQRGNPLGGLIFSNAFASNNGNNNTYQQVIEWHKYVPQLEIDHRLSNQYLTASWARMCSV